jgi:hypothetical protein
MLLSKRSALIVLSLAVICTAHLLNSPVAAQYKIDVRTCDDLKIAETQYGVQVVETATCVTPTKAFSPKGTLRNVNILATFPAVATGAGITFMVTRNDANGEYVQNVDYAASPITPRPTPALRSTAPANTLCGW